MSATTNPVKSMKIRHTAKNQVLDAIAGVLTGNSTRRTSQFGTITLHQSSSPLPKTNRMKKHLFAVLLVSALTGLQSYGMTFQQALSGRYISFSASAHSGSSQARAVIRNLTSKSVDVDFSSVCFYQNNSSQRIGFTSETSTGAYYLRFPANWSGTLIFNSRCLDQNRPTPTTGTSYSAYVSISSEFIAIINALRSNASQSTVWSITDSGSLAVSWKAADPRGTYGGGGGNGGGTESSSIALSGSCSWRVSGRSITLRAAQVVNRGNARSGRLRLRVWATRSRYSGLSLSGYVLGTRNLNPLNPGYQYSNFSGWVNYSRPPRGTYYTVMTVEEYTSGGWRIRSYVNFSRTTRF